MERYMIYFFVERNEANEVTDQRANCVKRILFDALFPFLFCEAKRDREGVDEYRIVEEVFAKRYTTRMVNINQPKRWADYGKVFEEAERGQYLYK
ncbi:unnamed protein product [Rhizophagus irregularis]|nr:unnamed protein product [Rhizophagus irregularis]